MILKKTHALNCDVNLPATGFELRECSCGADNRLTRADKDWLCKLASIIVYSARLQPLSELPSIMARQLKDLANE
jgi:hypothetical protein